MASPNPNADPIWNTWPAATRAAAKLGIRRQELMKFVESGELKEVTAADGTKRYDPATIEELVGDLKAVNLNETRSETPEGLLRVATDMLAKQGEQINRLLDILIKGFDQSMGVLERSNTKLAEANAKFESAHWDAVAAREDALNDKAERELKQAELEATNKRRQTIVDTVGPGVRPILTAMADAVKGWATLHPASKLVSSFRTEQLELLLETELLSPDQKELLRNYLESRKGQADGSKEGNAQDSEANQATQDGKEGNAQADNQAQGREEKQRSEAFEESQ